MHHLFICCLLTAVEITLLKSTHIAANCGTSHSTLACHYGSLSLDQVIVLSIHQDNLFNERKTPLSTYSASFPEPVEVGRTMLSLE